MPISSPPIRMFAPVSIETSGSLAHACRNSLRVFSPGNCISHQNHHSRGCQWPSHEEMPCQFRVYVLSILVLGLSFVALIRYILYCNSPGLGFLHTHVRIYIDVGCDREPSGHLNLHLCGSSISAHVASCVSNSQPLLSGGSLNEQEAQTAAGSLFKVLHSASKVTMHDP